LNTPATTQKIIEIVVGPTGQAVVQTKGFAGPSCREASRFIESALGEAVADRNTAEFYQPQVAEQRAGQG